MENWILKWFNSQYYSLLYNKRDKNEAENFVQNLISNKHINSSSQPKVIDLACGNGRFSKALDSNGFEVLGLDISDYKIDLAKSQTYLHREFEKWDMLDPFPTKNMDIVFNLFTSFGYYDEDEKDILILQNVANSLKKGGLFVFDFLNVKFALDNLKPKETIEKEKVVFNIKKELKDGFIQKNIEIIDDGEFQFSVTEKVKFLELDFFKKHFPKIGFDILFTWGSYDLSPFQVDKSPRLILLAKKI